jgi:hypothetical protein
VRTADEHSRHWTDHLQRHGVRKSFAIPLDEINVMQGVRHHRRSGGQAIVRAHRWRQMLESGEYNSSAELAKAEKVNDSYLSRISA